MQKQTALVIGAGIGGIATAARLAKNGYDVKLSI
jgi:phytoene dehydrogenase-like protein